MFRAIDNHNCVIENIEEGQKPLTVEGAAQAYFQGFSADFSEFQVSLLAQSWIDQEVEHIQSQYDCDFEVAKKEAIDRWNLRFV